MSQQHSFVCSLCTFVIVYSLCGHSGIKHMLYFVRVVSARIPRAALQEVIRNCDKCQSIDLAPMHWKMGRLDVYKNWSRIGMDVTYSGG